MPVPVPEGRYSQVVGIKGKILLTSWPVQGSLGRDIFSGGAGPRGTLEAYDLGEQRHEVLTGGISTSRSPVTGRPWPTARAAASGSSRRGRSRPTATTARAAAAAGSTSTGSGSRSTPAASGCRCSRRPGGSSATTSGPRTCRASTGGSSSTGTLPLVGKVATRLEFSDLMWEMQGELGTSHAYELGGDYRPAPAYLIAHLGADLAYDPDADGTGRRHLAVHPHRRRRPVGPGRRLAAAGAGRADRGRRPAPGRQRPAGRRRHHPGGAARQPGRAGGGADRRRADGSGRRTVVVSTLRDDRPARYREWVSANRARVHEATGGRVGYVHVPDMGARGYAEFHRSYLAEVERDALVVDVRFNGGGHVCQLVLEKLARRRIGYDISRWGEPEPYPADSPAGPLVALTNEHAGSDGDIFTHCFKLLGLGRWWASARGAASSASGPATPWSTAASPPSPSTPSGSPTSAGAWRTTAPTPTSRSTSGPRTTSPAPTPSSTRRCELALSALQEHRPLSADLAQRPRPGTADTPAPVPGRRQRCDAPNSPKAAARKPAAPSRRPASRPGRAGKEPQHPAEVGLGVGRIHRPGEQKALAGGTSEAVEPGQLIGVSTPLATARHARSAAELDSPGEDPPRADTALRRGPFAARRCQPGRHPPVDLHQPDRAVHSQPSRSGRPVRLPGRGAPTSSMAIPTPSSARARRLRAAGSCGSA